MAELRLEDWIGKTEYRDDAITAWPVAALSATLDRDDPPPQPGDPLPPAWHWLYFLEAKPASQLGPDGHARRGGFLPPVPLPRRMWAGGRIEFLAPLRVGDHARRKSEILSVEKKEGRSGSLVFVMVRHTISVGEVASIREEHDIVYRDAAKPSEAAPQGRPAPAQAKWSRELIGDTVTLFRYSALTFNGHRIHYDLDYVRDEEHYPGLIVHGPLQTTQLLDLCRRNDPRPIRKFDYRALLPVFHGERYTVNGEPSHDGASARVWTANPAGFHAMTGTAYF